jgi:hypothetical protein
MTSPSQASPSNPPNWKLFALTNRNGAVMIATNTLFRQTYNGENYITIGVKSYDFSNDSFEENIFVDNCARHTFFLIGFKKDGTQFRETPNQAISRNTTEVDYLLDQLLCGSTT